MKGKKSRISFTPSLASLTWWFWFFVHTLPPPHIRVCWQVHIASENKNRNMLFFNMLFSAQHWTSDLSANDFLSGLRRAASWRRRSTLHGWRKASRPRTPSALATRSGSSLLHLWDDGCWLHLPRPSLHDVGKAVPLCTLNLYSDECQLLLNKTRKNGSFFLNGCIIFTCM